VDSVVMIPSCSEPIYNINRGQGGSSEGERVKGYGLIEEGIKGYSYHYHNI
jgi:hypothetical protein